MSYEWLVLIALWCQPISNYSEVKSCRNELQQCVRDSERPEECFKIEDPKPWPNFNNEKWR